MRGREDGKQGEHERETYLDDEVLGVKIVQFVKFTHHQIRAIRALSPREGEIFGR